MVNQGDSVLKHVYIEDTTLSLRVRNTLLRAGIKTLYDLSNYSELDLLSLKNFGQNSLDEINEFIYKCENNKYFWEDILNLNHLPDSLSYEKITLKDSNNGMSKTLRDKRNETNTTNMEQIPEIFFQKIDIIDGLSDNVIQKLKKMKIRKIGQLAQYTPEQLLIDEEIYNKLIEEAIFNDTCEIPEYYNYDNDIKIINNFFKEHDIDYPVELSSKQKLSLLEYTPEETIELGWINIVVELFESAFDKLQPRNRDILKERLGINSERKIKTLEEIGQINKGVTRERIRQIEKQSINKIKKYLLDSGYIAFINKLTKSIFNNFGSVYYEKNEDVFYTYKTLIEKFSDKFDFSIDNKTTYIVENKEWFDDLKDSIFNAIEDNNDYTISKINLLDLICTDLNKIVKNETSYQIENYNHILNDVKKAYLEHYLIKVDDNNYKILKTSKRSRTGKVKTDDRNDEIIALFATTFPEGVHLPIDKQYLLEKNLKPLTDKLPYKISIRTLSDGIIKNAKQIILWDRGIYRHVDTVQIQWSAVDNAIDEILSEFDNGNSIFSIKKIYDNNQELYLNAGIPNYTALLGLIKYRENPRIGNSKLEVFDIENEGDNINKTDIIEQYLLDAGDWVSTEEMQKHFCDDLGWENYQIDQYVYNTKNTRKDTRLGFIHFDILKKRINRDALQELLNQLYRQVKFTHKPMKLESLRRSSFSKTWVKVLEADVSGNFMSDFIDSLITKKGYPLLFYQGSAYSSDYKSDDLIACLNIDEVIKNYEEHNYNKLYTEFEFFDKELLDKIMRSHIKIANVLFDKNLQDMCDYFYSNNINNLGTLLFFPFNCIEFKKQFTDSQIKKTIKKVYSWVESFEDSQEEGNIVPDISSIFWRN